MLTESELCSMIFSEGYWSACRRIWGIWRTMSVHCRPLVALPHHPEHGSAAINVNLRNSNPVDRDSVFEQMMAHDEDVNDCEVEPTVTVEEMSSVNAKSNLEDVCAETPRRNHNLRTNLTNGKVPKMQACYVPQHGQWTGLQSWLRSCSPRTDRLTVWLVIYEC